MRFSDTLMLLLFVCLPAEAQWTAQAGGTKARLRGVSVAGDQVAWACGTGGTFLRTTDGGEHWRSASVPGAEALDFRDVHAFDGETALLLAIGEGEKSRIYRTIDGGATWTLAHRNRDPRIFLDAVAMADRDCGLALGDPVDGEFILLSTLDGGSTWERVPPGSLPPCLPGEGAFAASGTCLIATRDGYAFGTGGAAEARVFLSEDRGKTWTARSTPIRAGNPSSGIFSIAILDDGRGVAVGGDYRSPGSPKVVALTTDSGRTWSAPTAPPPSGYRSAVGFLPIPGRARLVVAVGPTGADLSTDDGRSWRPFGTEGFHALGVSPRGLGVWAVGEDGKIARFRPPAGDP